MDETLSEPLPLPRPRRSAPVMLLIALLAFALGGVLVGWLAHSGQLPYVLPGHAGVKSVSAPIAGNASVHAPAQATAVPSAGDALGSIETRLALIEDRLGRIDGQATAASGNAARAEALLIAYAARRRIDKGEPLGFVEDQLRLRFSSAQPRAVDTIVAAAKTPVTLDQLGAQLDLLAPALAGTRRDESTWTRVRREVANLFVVRRAPVPLQTPQDRVARARLMLVSGQIDGAIMEVGRLPGAEEAQAWTEAARRYEDAQRALDVIETAAMLEPHTLRDASGKPVDQPSPLSPPADMPSGAAG
jgi:hypothetical protein